MSKPRGTARNEEARRELTNTSAMRIASTWVTDIRAALAADGRRAIGGWPGTVAEARERTRRYFVRERMPEWFGTPSTIELEAAARLAYPMARAHWAKIADGPEESRIPPMTPEIAPRSESTAPTGQSTATAEPSPR